ncbi:MAG TPA: hypothetical protein VHK23_04200, partial [Miltoncostaeaceae bacterium]|nr:hypothetical protein [Miltoncostaeaceae bacterium]
LRRAQRPGGGFPLNGGVINSQSTAYAAQGLVAAGVSPASVRRGGRSPLDYLSSVQAGDGHYRYSASSDQTPVWVTAQALLAANGAAFPLSPVRRAMSPPAPAPGATKGQRKDTSAAKASKPDQKGSTPASAAPAAAGQATPVPLSAASSRGDGGDREGVPAWLIVLAAAAAAAAAVWGGWVLYRRRLPDHSGEPGHH